MVGPRDIGWGIVLGVLGVLLVQTYPLWSAERMLARDAEQAFANVFEGRRMADGTLISPEGVTAAPKAFMAPIYFRRLEVVASHADWNAKHLDLLVKHIVGFDETLDELNPTHEILVRLDRDTGSFTYRQFQVRGFDASPLATEGNPWFPLMHAAAEAERTNPRDRKGVRGAAELNQ